MNITTKAFDDYAQNDLILKNEVYRIISCALEVQNHLGCGFLEKVYENALCVEFRQENIPFCQQKQFQIDYKGTSIGTYIPDLLVFDKIIVDTKTIERITNAERAQILNYLKITKCKVGLIINFKHTRLEWERIVL